MNIQSEDIDVKQIAKSPNAALRTYALFVVGSPSLWRCLHYEALMGICAARGGAFGIALRRLCYRKLFRSSCRGLVVGKNVTIRGARNITLGNNVLIDDNCVLDARGSTASIEIGDNVVISRNSVVRSRNAKLRIGMGCDIGCNCLLATDSELTVGNQVLLGAYSYLCAGGLHQFDSTEPCVMQQGIAQSAGITVGDGAWIGTRVTVLDGASVGAGAVIGAHSLVTKSIPDMAVAHGSPASVKRQR